VKILEQPKDASVKMGETYCAEVIAEGTGLTYQWYFRNAGQKTFRKSYIQDSTYDDIMNEIRAGRSVYCIVTDIWGNSVRTDTVQLIRAD
jgi:hypothetical protein